MSIQRLGKALALTALLAAFGQGVPATRPSLDSLVKDLSNNNYAARENAQKLLLETPIAQLDRLRRIVSSVSDPEAVIRLQAIMKSLESIESTSTPPVTINVANASFSEVGKALAQATGTAIEGDNLASDARFTLNAVDATG